MRGYALDPGRSVWQYVRSEWGKDKGFPGGTVYAICESGDGYLWLGTDRGLVRFDGERFTLVQRPIPGQPAIGAVRGLAEDHEGSLWIRPQLPQILVYRNGQFKDASTGGGLPLTTITAMASDNRGGVLFSGFGHPSMRYANGTFEPLAEAGSAPGTILSMAETQDGRIWLGTRESGLLVIRNGRPERDPRLDLPEEKINALAAAHSGGLWVGTDQGLRLVTGKSEIKINLPGWNNDIQIIGMATDSSGNIWAASSRGLIRVTPQGTVSIVPGHGGKTVRVTAVYVDGAGNVWFGGPDGLERLRDGLFASYSSQDGIPLAHGGAIFADSSRRVWIAPETGGLYFLRDGHAHRVNAESLDRDLVYSITGRNNEIWVGRQHGGLTRLRFNGSAVESRTFTRNDGLAQNTVFSTYVSQDGTVWAGTISGGLSRLRNGVFTTYTMANGLSSNAINSILEGADGTLWVGTSAGLDAWRGGSWTHVPMAEGLNSPEVRYCFEDRQRVLWIVTANGVAYISSGKIVIPSHLPDALRDQIFGMTEDDHGYFWLSLSDHVVRVSRDRLLADNLRDNDLQILGEEDGLVGAEGVRRDRTITTGADGKVWISVQEGIASADPVLAGQWSRPLAVRMEAISAAGVTYAPRDSPRIPAGTRSISIQFSGASPDSPQRFWYRYRLEGVDRDWSDPVQMRQVSYNNLRARAYRLRVIASRDGLLWDGPEGDVEFSIDHEFWEAAWFQVGAALALTLIIAFLLRLRTIRLSRQWNARFQERLAERTRLAVELHDTLLQSVQATKMIADNARESDAQDPAHLRRTIESISEWLEQAVTEARTALNDLRHSSTEKNDLARAFQQAAESIGIVSSMNFVLSVQGTPRELHPIVRDEIYRVGSEALRNAHRHSEARNVELILTYGHALTVRVLDNGIGMGVDLANSGKPGHFGLRGMKERAGRIGATLRITSRVRSGTEVELLVPGKVVYQDAAGKRTMLQKDDLHDRTDPNSDSFRG